MMKRLAVIVMLLVAPHAYAQEVEIKGLRIGMTLDEVKKLYPSGYPRAGEFSVARIVPAFPALGVAIKYDNDKLSRLSFIFKSRDFFEMRDTLKLRYENLRCVDSVLVDNHGRQFTQINCSYKELRLERYFGGDLTVSHLELMSDAYREERAREREKELMKRSKDL
jgi:hypothetical protein